MDGLITIGELAMAVRQTLAETSYPGQRSGRIREVPDSRTIRYYTTIGLLDKPIEMRGRTAYYGLRHLLQLVAIKRLQAQGKSLVEIQALLAGASDSALLKWVDSPPDGLAKTIEQQAGKSEAAVSESAQVGRERFWAATPQAAASVSIDNPTPPAATSAVHLKVMDNVTLVIEGAQADALDEETLSTLQPALENLKNALTQNGDRLDPNNRPTKN